MTGVQTCALPISDESGEQTQYDENGNPIQGDESGEQMQYDDSEDMSQSDESGNQTQYDEYGNPL